MVDGKTPRTCRRRAGWVRCAALLPIAFAAASASDAADPPQVLFKDLFIAVQSAQIYADGKAFPDAIPKAAPDDILKQYHAERPDSPAALKRFRRGAFHSPAGSRRSTLCRPTEYPSSRTSTVCGMR